MPPYINNYQMQEEIEDLSRTATYSRMSEAEIRKAVLNRASDLGIELDERQVMVRKATGSVDIAVHYEIPVDLLVQQVVLTFEPSAGNRNIATR
ncbi:MAG: DUF4845 domain-containing protein [Acidobacteria bacterium]|nr:DUF4845 domain-containing protein [Acidobacteriota bacterium]